ncbi:uncharacterized protein VP01_1361g2 [Puccinia sorghi]|uniref:Uncharacterized protein n=1 Tax=Puccinia sorghi TaxID=27349 RepID=A0A0L6VM24_9BASI|nr:uncharacterized protein VP01_1361g2 [Puccinia sorghi]
MFAQCNRAATSKKRQDMRSWVKKKDRTVSQIVRMISPNPSITDICLISRMKGGRKIWKQPRLTKGRWQEEEVKPVCKKEGSCFLSIHNVSDGFSELEWGFQPELFPLELPLHGIHSSWLEHLKPATTINLAGNPLTSKLKSLLQPTISTVGLTSSSSCLVPQLSILTAQYNLSSCLWCNPIRQSSFFFVLETRQNQYPDNFIRSKHGSLISWAQAGVLLLDIVQTARRDDETAHAKFGRQEFTRQVLQIVSWEGGSVYNDARADTLFQKGIVYVGWGSREIHAAGILPASSID